MAADNEIREDIEEAKINKSASIQIVDGKVTAQFTRYKSDENSEWISYPKIFDNMEDFSSYATKFFELEN